ncbi:response regulator [Fundidesulfovibrio butyratiphilus]
MEPAVLIVEDERIIALDMRQKLRRLGFTVPAVAHNGEDAIRLAAQIRPDLVLMDIMLEGEMDGVEAAERIRLITQAPVVFVSACNDEPTKSRALNTSRSDFVTKPVNMDTLRVRMLAILERTDSDRAS